MNTGCATYGNANLAITLFQLPSPRRSGGTLRPYRLQSDICVFSSGLSFCVLLVVLEHDRRAVWRFTCSDYRLHCKRRRYDPNPSTDQTFVWLASPRSTNSHSTVAILLIIDFPRKASPVIDMLAGGSKT